MRDESILPEPARIVEEDGAAGLLLRSAQRGFNARLSEPRAFRRLERRRKRRALVARSSTLALAAVAVLGLAFASRWHAQREPAPISRDFARVAAPRDEAPKTSASLDETPRPVASVTSARAALPTPKKTEPANEATCAQWSASGNGERAVECFSALAKGDSVHAEVALYEAARLAFERLHDAPRALVSLEEHRKRFPEGALRGEVEWLRIQALERVGRYADALAASEALLATPSGRALAAELHLLRGRIYQDRLGDCARASSELVALLGEKSQLGDEGELRRAECLEALGRSADAEAAFAEYLKRAEPLGATTAREHLRTLEQHTSTTEVAP